MNALYPKIHFDRLEEFLQSLTSDTIVEMWIRLCEYNNYDFDCFNWADFSSMVIQAPDIVGIEIVHDFDGLEEGISDAEIQSKIDNYFKED